MFLPAWMVADGRGVRLPPGCDCAILLISESSLRRELRRRACSMNPDVVRRMTLLHEHGHFICWDGDCPACSPAFLPKDRRTQMLLDGRLTHEQVALSKVMQEVHAGEHAFRRLGELEGPGILGWCMALTDRVWGADPKVYGKALSRLKRTGAWLECETKSAGAASNTFNPTRIGHLGVSASMPDILSAQARRATPP